MRRLLLLVAATLLFMAGVGVGLAAVLLVAPQVAGLAFATAAPAVATAPPTATPTPLPPVVRLPADMRAVLEAEEVWLETLYANASPSVVNITSRSYSYDFFFNVVPQEGTGSGFVWDTQGHIVTNYHVIKDAQKLEVKLADGSQVGATIVGIDPPNDLAVIKLVEVPESPLRPLPLGPSDRLRVGQRVVAIGNPFGFERTLTTGVVSALGRVIQSETGDFIGEAIQTDAAINPGNSGGPLLNVDGEVIGVNSQMVSPSGASAGIGFAIPSSVLGRVVPELIARGRYPHPWLGVEGFDLTPGLALRLRRAGLEVPVERGVLVVGVYRYGPADGLLRGGQQRVRIGNLILPIGGDLIVAIDGQPIEDQRKMLLYLESHKRVGDSVQVRLYRGAQPLEVTLTLSERPERR